MKKILVTLICALALGASAASAQIEQEGLGIRAGWDLNSASTSFNKHGDIYTNGSGFSVGAFYDIPLYRALYFEPGLSVFYNTFGIDDITIGAEEFSGVLNGSLRNWGFRVPLIFGYRFDFTDDIALSVITGPQVNIGLSLKEHLKAKGFGHEESGSSDNLYGNGWHRLDAQWLFGVRLHYQDNWVAEITGGVGMTNMLGGSEYDGQHFRRNTFSISLGYMF